MRAYHITILFIIITSCSIAQLSGDEDQDLVGKERQPRRSLHEPLVPSTSPPPPVIESSPLPRPPPADQDQPFFGAVPGGSTLNQPQQLPPSPPANGVPVSNNSVAREEAQQSKPIKKVAIVISVGIVTLGMLSALAFYLIKHRVNHPREPQKLVANNISQRRINEESRIQPSNFLYIGTVEQSNQESVNGNNDTANGSPYPEIRTAKVSDRYRPSPDLQPLPPLSKPRGINSPPPMSSSDEEESHDGTAFYTPRGLSVGSEEGFYSPIRHQSYQGNRMQQSKSKRISSSPVPHSKRISPKSRLAASPPNVKPTTIPSIQQSPGLPPLSPQQVADSSEPESSEPHEQGSNFVLPFLPKRLKFSAPPLPPDMSRFLSTNNQNQQPHDILTPPPPPPPPPPLRLGVSNIDANSAISQKRKKEQSTNSLPPRTTPEGFKQHSIEELSKEASSSDIHVCDNDDDDGSRPKLKPLHWDKVKASSGRATVWDQLKSSSFQLNEDMIESLFINSTTSVPKENTKKHGIASVEKEIRVIDPKKSQNIAIFLRALNVSKDEVSEALLEGNQEGLELELLETLVKMAPTKEEEIKLVGYNGDITKLGPAERFLKEILDVPFAFTRVEAMLYRKNFDTEMRYLRDSYNTLEEACTELKSSRLFLKLLEAVLRTGNRMNVGTKRGDARAFKLDTLLKLVDIKGTDGKTTLLHFVVQEIIKSEKTSSNPTDIGVTEQVFKKEELQIVSGLGKELSNTKKAAGMDSDVLHGYLAKLQSGLHKVKAILQYENQSCTGKFVESTKIFVEKSEQDIYRIKAEEQKTMLKVREVTDYFHGDAVKEEAHPFRIFMIVRDFLAILDNVCREVGGMQERTIVGSARSFSLFAHQ